MILKDSYTRIYWAKFKDGTSGSIQGNTAQEAVDNCGKEVVECDSLPYPASPQVGPTVSGCPMFCHSPESCKGRTSCPQNYSCSE